jgi:hypothetical protein
VTCAACAFHPRNFELSSSHPIPSRTCLISLPPLRSCSLQHSRGFWIQQRYKTKCIGTELCAHFIQAAFASSTAAHAACYNVSLCTTKTSPACAALQLWLMRALTS